ncbi:MAG: DUF4330 domain-containing protein [Oscillospiraceae bacterium]|jgi:hypothetical protein|nr:DUF4330 domain-containing protein [Oscillospiraceae bacterium]
MMKKAYHFNWIDALVCLLLVLLAAGAMYKFTAAEHTGAANHDVIRYVVQIPAGKASTVDSVRPGDVLYDSDSGNAIGTVTEVNAEPALKEIPLPDGTCEWGTIDDRYDLYITVEAEGTVNDRRERLVNRTYQIQVGAEHTMNTRYRSFTGLIWDIL